MDIIETSYQRRFRYYRAVKSYCPVMKKNNVFAFFHASSFHISKWKNEWSY